MGGIILSIPWLSKLGKALDRHFTHPTRPADHFSKWAINLKLRVMVVYSPPQPGGRRLMAQGEPLDGKKKGTGPMGRTCINAAAYPELTFLVMNRPNLFVPQDSVNANVLRWHT